jgi:hypothetical protein
VGPFFIQHASEDHKDHVHDVSLLDAKRWQVNRDLDSPSCSHCLSNEEK